MSGKLPSSTSFKGKDIFPFDFFAALNNGDDDVAIDRLRQEALPDGEVPTPRAEALIKSGEWDSNQKVSLVFIEANACAGRIGNDEYRFCGKPANYCTVGIHTKVTVGTIKRGWYISCMGKSQGVLTSPYLPAYEDGGPIRPSGAGRLADGDNPFRLSRGQWKFVIDSWHATTVETISDDSGADDRSQASVAPIFAPDTLQIVTGDTSPDMPSLERVSEHSLSSTDEETKARGRLSNMERIRQLEKQVSDLLTLHQKQQDNFEAKYKQLTDVFTDRLQTLESERNVLIQTVSSMHERFLVLERASERSPLGAALPTDLMDKFAEIDRAVLSPQGAFANLKLQFSQFREKIESGGGIECHGISFSSKRELISWFETKEPPVEIFLDALAYLHAIRPAVVHQDEASRQRESQLKTSMSSYLQVALFTSFDTIIPSVLVSGKRMTDSGGSVFDWLKTNLKTFEIWKPKGGQTNGVSQQILDGIRRVTDRTAEVRDLQTTDAQAILLSTSMCHDSALFCQELVRFISEQHDVLTTDTTFTPQQVWMMQLECLQKIIEELSEARESVADAARFQPAYYLWGMLKAWKIQQRYLANHFKDDPALTGIMVRRILMHGEDSSVKDKLAKIDSVSNKVEEHHRQNVAELKKIKETLATLKNK